MTDYEGKKKKKPLWRRFLRWILGTILSIVVMLGGFCLYLYLRHHINVIEVIGQVKVLNQSVNVDRLAPNQYSDEDLTNAQNKIDNIADTQNAVRFSDKELAAYLNETVQTQEGGMPMKIGSSTVNLVDYGFAIVQMEFSNISQDSESDKMTDFNIVLKIELKKFKQEQMGKFPLKWIANIVPNSLYFSFNVEINKAEDGGYETVSKYMTINNLSASQTDSIFKTFDTFLKIGTAQNFNKSISDEFVKVMIGENGFYEQLRSQGSATGYSFENDGTNNNFIIYTADTEEHHTITYHDNETTELEYYTITDNTFAPKAMSKNGYTFLGWYDGEGEDANKITSIDATLLQDIELYARWQINEYTLTYQLDDGNIVGTNPATYTVETDTFTLINPTKANYGFAGWTWEGQNEPIAVVTIEKGSTGNRNFVAHFEADSYTINYKDQNNEVFSGTFASGTPTVHRFDQTTTLLAPTKTGYTFNGWFDNAACEGDPITTIDATVAEETTIYAKWTINQYTLTIKLNNEEPDIVITQNYGTEIAEQANPTRTGFTFSGWSEPIPATMPAVNKTINAQWEANNYTLSFDTNGGNTIDSRPITYRHSYGELPTPEKLGYEFIGWYSDNTFTTQITSETVFNETNNVTIYANWNIIKYTISYELNSGSVLGVNPTFYYVTDADITLINPTREGCNFLGWTGTGLSERTLTVVIPHGSVGNRSYSAIYDDSRQLNVVIDGKNVTIVNFNYGDSISTNNLINADDLGMTGYSVEHWYKNQGMTESWDETEVYTENTNIYGSWTYLTNRVYFYTYLSEFDNVIANNQAYYTITSRAHLMAYMDYVRFYNVTKEVKLKLDYNNIATTSKAAVDNEMTTTHNNLIAATDFQTLSAINSIPSYKEGPIYYTSYYIQENNITKEARYVMDPSKENVYTQKDYSLKSTNLITARTYKIDNVSKTLSVATSEQLFWALENGYKPEFTAFSNENHSAQRIYNAAKDVLAQICKNSMTDLEKAKAIYEWLILNVQYDNLGAYKSEHSLITAAEAKEYDTWYADGVFNHGVAVCEGIAKAFVIMARIENIPAVMVVNSSHAWNKVYIGGQWYGIDATHGNVLGGTLPDEDSEISGKKGIEIMTYDSFMFTDSYKASRGYIANNYTGFVANTVYNYYETVQKEYNSEAYNLQIDSEAELTTLMKHAKSLASTMSSAHYTIEFAVNSDTKNDYINGYWLTHAANAAGVTLSTFIDPGDSMTYYVGNVSSDSAGNTVYVFVIS